MAMSRHLNVRSRHRCVYFRSLSIIPPADIPWKLYGNLFLLAWTTLITQNFFSWRVWRLSNKENRIVPGFISLLSVLQLSESSILSFVALAELFLSVIIMILAPEEWIDPKAADMNGIICASIAYLYSAPPPPLNS